MRRIAAKYSDWLLLILLSALAFWILGRPLFARGQLYHDNVRLYSVFRDALNAANQHGELMLWNPEYSGLGFPAFYFTHLVPLALTVSFYALARQLVRHPLARTYLLVVAAFSPGVLFLGPWPALAADQFSIPTWDARRQYADGLLDIEGPAESQAPAPDSLPEFGLFADAGARDPAPVPGASIRSTRQTYNTRIFEAQADREVQLVWRNRFFTGWTASVRPIGEGARETAAAPVARAFGKLMAARIPAGHSEVTFRFAPAGFFPLFLWTYLSLSGFAIFTAWIAWRR